MKIIKVFSHAIFALFMVSLSARCYGQVDPDVAPMEKRELDALYSTIQGFVGDWWNGSDLYPDPCGWTPIQVLLAHLHNCSSCCKFPCNYLYTVQGIRLGHSNDFWNKVA